MAVDTDQLAARKKELEGDPLVKVIFDHIRNMTVAVGILVGSYWLQANVRHDGWVEYWDKFAAFFFGFVGLSLITMNQLNLSNQLGRQRWSLWIHLGFGLSYGILLTTFVRYVEKVL